MTQEMKDHTYFCCQWTIKDDFDTMNLAVLDAEVVVVIFGAVCN